MVVPVDGPKSIVFTGSARYVLSLYFSDMNELVLQFVEDEGDVVFFKNAYGVAKARGVFTDNTASDSGVEMK